MTFIIRTRLVKIGHVTRSPDLNSGISPKIPLFCTAFFLYAKYPLKKLQPSPSIIRNQQQWRFKQRQDRRSNFPHCRMSLFYTKDSYVCCVPLQNVGNKFFSFFYLYLFIYLFIYLFVYLFIYLLFSLFLLT